MSRSFRAETRNGGRLRDRISGESAPARSGILFIPAALPKRALIRIPSGTERSVA
jgi:hypothetical protein